MPPQHGFRNPKLNEIKSAPALVKVTIDDDSVKIIVNEFERLERRVEELEYGLQSLTETFLNIQAGLKHPKI